MARARRSTRSHPAEAGAELIVISRPAAGLRIHSGGDEIASISGADTAPLRRVLKGGVRLVPLFGDEERLIAQEAAVASVTGTAGPELARFYHVEAPASRLNALAEELRRQPTIEAAYIKPAAEPPSLTPPAAESADAPPVTPDFIASQGYLGAAPGGIEALWAHGQPGGKGQSVRIIDIEGAWRFSHEDLKQVQGGMVGGTASPDLGWRDHGTAVIGEFGGDENGIGIVGISPRANTRAISIFGANQGSSKAIVQAANLLSAGDIILIELHRPGPRHNFQSRPDQKGYIAIEWWEDDYAAIRYATNKGVIVVEAAGNGGENLDDAIYSVRPAGFPATWTNPFNRSNRDSRAIMVGAGAPPPGTHGRSHGPDRSRLDFSNYGALIDAQGWGREVTTTGYGHLQKGNDEDFWYTDQFSGTSSASPIVVGAVACVEGNRKAKGLAVLTPLQVRNKLRTTGSPQQDAPGRPATQRIGNRPNLKQLLGISAKSLKVEKLEFKEGKSEMKEGKSEIKENKQELKELKQEIKEGKREKIEKVELKEGKSEFEKKFEKFFEGFGGLLKGMGGFGASGPSGQGGDLDTRLAGLEAAVSQLAHFINSALRPDLSQGALSQEEDVAAMRSELDQAESEAKSYKDAKDAKELDKPSEG
jgi:subtilisin family serine protease